MKVAVINEVSARDKNQDIIRALENGRSSPKCGDEQENQDIELTYIHTGLMAGILLILSCGLGCGWLRHRSGLFGQRHAHPNVFGGLIKEPLDAWLFSQINGETWSLWNLTKAMAGRGDKSLVYL